MIQDISPEFLDIGYFPDAQPDADSVVFSFRGRDVLCRNDTPPRFPTFSELGVKELRYLFEISGRRYFLAPDNCDAPDDLIRMDIRQLRSEQGASNTDILALFTAYHLNEWYSANRFCGRCGAETVVGNRERSMLCPDCGNIIYPRINPAVIVGITCGNSLLITRYAKGYAHDALVAGFVEIGETLEDTVRREVMEEVGLRVKNIRYYKSQPWGASMSLLAGFFCEVDGDPTIRMDESELKSAVWVDRERIAGQPDDLSLTNDMMMTFKTVM